MARKSKGRLYQRKRGSNWYLQYYVKGEQHRVSLKTTDKDEAERKRQAIINPLQFRDEAERLKRIQHDIDDAEKAREEAEEAVRDKLRLAEAWEAYIESRRRPRSGDSTLRQYSFQWQAFTEWVKATHPDVEHLHQVTPQLAEEYATHLEKRKLTANTQNKHIRLLRLVFRILGKAEGMEENPFIEIEPEPEQQENRRALSLEKLSEICDAAEGELKKLLIIGIYTGLRLADCCLLTWDEVDLMRDILVVKPRKTARRRKNKQLEIPIASHLRPILEATPSDQRSGYVLPDMAEKYDTRNDLVTDMVRELFVQCGVQVHKPGTGPGTKKRAVIQYGFHSLRHSAVTIMLEAGVPVSVVQAIVGHTTISMTKRYTHIGRRTLTEAVQKAFPALNGNGKMKQLPDPRNRVVAMIDRATPEQLELIEAEVAKILKG